MSPDLYEEVKSKEEQKEVLGIKPKEEEVISETTKAAYRFSYRAIFDSVKMTVAAVQGSSPEEQAIKVKVPQGFKLQDLFDEWCESESKDKTYIFRSLDHYKVGHKKFQKHAHAWKILMDWNVQYGLEGKEIFLCYYAEEYFKFPCMIATSNSIGSPCALASVLT